MGVDKRVSRLFREDSEDPIDLIIIKGGDESLDKSSSQGGSTVESTPPSSFSGVVGNSKNRQTRMSSRRVSVSQPTQSSRNLHARNESKLALRRDSSSIVSSTSMNTLVSVKALPKDTSRKVLAKRKFDISEDAPRARKKLSVSVSETSETTSPSEPLPGRTSDGRIDYRYYIAKYLNQR